MSVVSLLGQDPINSAVTAGRGKFVSLFRDKTPKYSETNRDGKNIRAYTNIRGLLIEKRFYMLPNWNTLNKGYSFQFNPDTVRDSRSTNYEQRDYSGLPFVDYVWAGGGERNISFQLFMDNTPQSKTENFRPDVEAMTLKESYGIEFLPSKKGKAYSSTRVNERGILDEVEKLQSFTYPARKNDADVPQFASGGIIDQDQFRSPETVIFSYGPMFLEGIIKNVDITYTLFDTDLTPIRATADIGFTVLEFEDISKNRYNISR